MISVSVEIKGMDELNAKLKKLSESLRGDVIGQSLEAGAKIIEGYAKVEVPVDTGFLRSTIQSGRQGDVAYVSASAEYASAVEYRNKPYMRPAVDNHLPEIERAIGENLKAALERAG